MLKNKDKVLALEFREALSDSDCIVCDEDLPKLVSKYHDELKLIDKEINDETKGEAFEEVLFWAIDSFNLTGEYIDWGDNIVSKVDNMPVLDFGTKNIRKNTAVIRFHITNKPKRDRLFDFWKKYCLIGTDISLKDVSNDFIPLFKKNKAVSGFKDLRWCGWEEEYCLHELIFGIKSVIAHDEHLYVCFDTSIVPNMPNEGMCSSAINPLLNLVYLLSYLDGVKKTWIKVRPASTDKLELYTSWPMMGDWPWALEVDYSMYNVLEFFNRFIAPCFSFAFFGGLFYWFAQELYENKEVKDTEIGDLDF